MELELQGLELVQHSYKVGHQVSVRIDKVINRTGSTQLRVSTLRALDSNFALSARQLLDTLSRLHHLHLNSVMEQPMSPINPATPMAYLPQYLANQYEISRYVFVAALTVRSLKPGMTCLDVLNAI
jgi:hypothetical protein